MVEDANPPETDIVHPYGKHMSWSEIFYFNLYDRKKDICGFMRIGLKPNAGEKNMFCYVMMPDGSTLGSRGQERFNNADLRVDGLSFDRIRSEKEWRIRYTGPMRSMTGGDPKKVDVSLDLTYRALSSTFDYRECGPWAKEFVSMAAAEHTEQFGSLQGVLKVGPMEISLDGLGEKDHAWGVKDWIFPTTWIWLSCQFTETHAFNLTKLMDKEVTDAGYLHMDGVNRPITKAIITTDWDQGGAPKALKIWFWEKTREVHQVDGEVIRSIKLPFTDTTERALPVMYACLVRYRTGDSLGYGIAEYLTR